MQKHRSSLASTIAAQLAPLPHSDGSERIARVVAIGLKYMFSHYIKKYHGSAKLTFHWGAFVNRTVTADRR